MAVPKARIAGRVLLVAGALLVAWLFAVWPPPIWWRDHEPRCTAMMRRRDDCRVGGRADGRTGRTRQPISLSAHPPRALERMVIIAEDSRFRTHHGIDFVEMREALAAGGRRGASTITQQLAKNLYLSPSRSVFRKLKEAVTALRLESALSKDRILELYLGAAEWGPGIWGVNAASQAYFGIPPSRLSNAQAAALAATLPQPRTSNPLYRPARMLVRRDQILARYYGGKTPVPRIPEDSIPDIPVIEPPVLPVIPVIPVIPVDSLVDSLRDSLIHQP